MSKASERQWVCFIAGAVGTGQEGEEAMAW